MPLRDSARTKVTRRHCEKRLASLELPRTCDIRSLVTHIAERIGHPIELVPRSLDPRSVSGQCELRHGVYRIVYQAHTSAWHQEHIISHELGHLISGHPCSDIGDEATDRPPPATRVLSAGTVARMLNRSQYGDPLEREAEIIGTLLQQHLATHAQPSAHAATWVAPALEHTWGGRA
ncbi:hypothetical protein [Streptomyces albireticuli]|uniref:hypothetical protein n=1 Tax=Streptomyces albireticuli TaxID=1940 RepID=UPI00117DF0E4|nr:hypothetical protein [Streptomyces albireticuli]MCD9145989.1 hypothetical protein [Streptomyces albireticuli]MCD9165751.1 hypothetical protein [Streptomyces albireticuli]MCD9195969.1 hypothetical protein [Streptomyces albireticuli]